MKLLTLSLCLAAALWKEMTLQEDGKVGMLEAPQRSNIGAEIKISPDDSIEIGKPHKNGKVWVKINGKWIRLTATLHDKTGIKKIVAMQKPANYCPRLPSLYWSLGSVKKLYKIGLDYAKRCNESYRKTDPKSARNPHNRREVMIILKKIP